MKEIKLTVAHSTLGEGNYESPVVKVAEFNTEGVLCASGDHEDWGIDDDLWS